MNAAESKSLKKGSRVYWLADANDGGVVTGISGMQLRLPGTMVMWPPYTMGICARSSKRDQSLLLCRYCVGWSSASGPSRHVASPHDICRFRGEADVNRTYENAP